MRVISNNVNSNKSSKLLGDSDNNNNNNNDIKIVCKLRLQLHVQTFLGAKHVNHHVTEIFSGQQRLLKLLFFYISPLCKSYYGQGLEVTHFCRTYYSYLANQDFSLVITLIGLINNGDWSLNNFCHLTKPCQPTSDQHEILSGKQSSSPITTILKGFKG